MCQWTSITTVEARHVSSIVRSVHKWPVQLGIEQDGGVAMTDSILMSAGPGAPSADPPYRLRFSDQVPNRQANTLCLAVWRFLPSWVAFVHKSSKNRIFCLIDTLLPLLTCKSKQYETKALFNSIIVAHLLVYFIHQLVQGFCRQIHALSSTCWQGQPGGPLCRL